MKHRNMLVCCVLCAVWDSSIVASKYLEKLGPSWLEGKRCLDLSAGCGLVGEWATARGEGENGECVRACQACNVGVVGWGVKRCAQWAGTLSHRALSESADAAQHHCTLLWS